jgi:hypothetical protein
MEYFFNNTHIKDDGRYLNNGTNTKLHSMSSRTFVIGWGVQNVYYKYLTVGVQLGVGFNNFGFSALKDGEYDHPMFYYQESKLFSDNLIMLKLNIGWVVY